MTTKDSFVIYMKCRPTGEILTARYEVHDGDSFAIIGGQEMTTAWCNFATVEGGFSRLLQSAITEAVNVPEERQLELLPEGF